MVQFVSGVFFLTESPRWLVANGKLEEARSILVRYHAGGDSASPLIDFEMSEIHQTIMHERENEKAAMWQLFKGRANRRRSAIAITLGICSQWVGNAIATYYLTLVLDTIGITNPTSQSLINGGLQLFNFAASVFAGALMVDRLGRRVLFLWSAMGMCLSYIVSIATFFMETPGSSNANIYNFTKVWTILTSQFIATKKTSFGVAVLPMIFIFYFHYDIAFTPLVYAYPTEIFPYSLRGLGVSLTYVTGHSGLIVSQFVNPIAMKNVSWRYYIVFCVVNAVLFVIVYCIFPETKGHSLEEIAVVFEGEKAAVNEAMAEKLESKIEKREPHGDYREVESVK